MLNNALVGRSEGGQALNGVGVHCTNQLLISNSNHYQNQYLLIFYASGWRNWLKLDGGGVDNDYKLVT